MEKKEKADLKASTGLNQKKEKAEEEIRPALYEQSLDKTLITEDPEKDLNAKILKITMTIKDKYPELSQYLEEMQDTIPDQKYPEITLKNLRSYYDSLTVILNKYIQEHPDQAK